MHTAQPSLAGLMQPNIDPTQRAHQVELGRVVAVHVENDSVDVELMQGGRLVNVPILRDAAGRLTGDAGLPNVTLGNGTATASGQNDTYAAIAFLRGNALLPIVLGFVGPKDSALLKRPAGSTIRREVGGQTEVAYANGDWEQRFAGGHFKVGANGNTASKLAIDATIDPDVGATSANMEIRNDAGVRVLLDGVASRLHLVGPNGVYVNFFKLDITGDLHVSAGTLNLGGGTLNLSGFTFTVPASGTAALRASAATAGRVAWWSDANSLSHDAAFVWDNTNKRIGLGTGTPLAQLHLVSPTLNTEGLRLSSGTGKGVSFIAYNNITGGDSLFASANAMWDGVNWQRFETAYPAWYIAYGGAIGDTFQIARVAAGANPVVAFTTMLVLNSSGFLGLGTAAPAAPLHILAGIKEALRLSSAAGRGSSFLSYGSGTGDTLFLSANAFFDGTAWQRLEIAAPAWYFQMGPGAGGDQLTVVRAAAGANPIAGAWVGLLTVNSGGDLLTGGNIVPGKILRAPVSSGGTGYGVRFAEAGVDYGNVQSLNIGGATYLLMTVNRQHDGTAWVSTNARAGTDLQVNDLGVQMYAFPAGSNAPTNIFSISTTGVLTLGSPLPVASGGTGVTVSPAFSATRSGAQNVVNITNTKVAFNAEEFDTNNNFDSTTNNRFLPTVAGKYLFMGAVRLNSFVSGQEYVIMLYKNGALAKRNSLWISSGNGSALEVTALIDMNGSTDYMELFVYQSTGGTIGIDPTGQYTYFQGARICA